MADSNPKLIQALRTTSTRLTNCARYEWGHMGRCNVGHLVQTITKLSDREIVRSIDHELDEWTEHARSYCAGSNERVEDLFRELTEVGLSYDDIIKLEYLSDREVLTRLGKERTGLRRNVATDVSDYMDALADLLEEETVTT